MEQQPDENPDCAEAMVSVAGLLELIGARIRPTETFIPNRSAEIPEHPNADRLPTDLGIDTID